MHHHLALAFFTLVPFHTHGPSRHGDGGFSNRSCAPFSCNSAPVVLKDFATLRLRTKVHRITISLSSAPSMANRFRVEGLLPSLPKLLDSSRDHTFIETMTVRHVYFSVVSLFLIVITNIQQYFGGLGYTSLACEGHSGCCHSQANELVLENAAD